MLISAKNNTLLKNSVTQGDGTPVAQGDTITITNALPYRDGHTLVTVSGMGNRFIFDKHWDTISLNHVKYLHQLDIYPDVRAIEHRLCNMACHYMACPTIPLDVFKSTITESTDHSQYTSLLSQYGIRSEWRTDGLRVDLGKAVCNNIATPVGVLHRGTLTNPTGGHVILVVGVYSDGYICHDPYGTWHDNYRSLTGGKFVRYNQKEFLARWQPHGTTGWYRKFY